MSSSNLLIRELNMSNLLIEHERIASLVLGDLIKNATDDQLKALSRSIPLDTDTYIDYCHVGSICNLYGISQSCGYIDRDLFSKILIGIIVKTNLCAAEQKDSSISSKNWNEVVEEVLKVKPRKLSLIEYIHNLDVIISKCEEFEEYQNSFARQILEKLHRNIFKMSSEYHSVKW